ncbi:hypothetical protein [Flavobacterium sp.]|uniref:hypothetical protein n=1 Tax=Flavobacterium sp. TaxID=239 RepID=UPI004048E963
MKNLNVNQMENLEAGGNVSCGIAVATSLFGIAACAATGPFGWIAGATIFGSALSVVDGCIGWA